MAKRSDHQTSSIISWRRRNKRFPQALLLAGFVAFHSNTPAQAQECTTTKECAQQMVLLANELKAENIALAKRVNDLETALANQSAAATAALNARFATLQNGGAEDIPTAYGNGKSSLCANGHYMVGIMWQIDGGGPHGIISSTQPICRTFP